MKFLKYTDSMKILLAGGGTLGSVSPLLAVWESLNQLQPQNKTLFIGTASGPEKNFLRSFDKIQFTSIPSGKLRRYFSLKNLFDPALILAGFIKSFYILANFRPQIVISTGSYVAVPVIFAAKLLKIKILIHQLDLKPTLSNKLVKNLADKITVTFDKKKSLTIEQPIKPVRSDVLNKIIEIYKK